jgi:hypothetical protein
VLKNFLEWPKCNYIQINFNLALMELILRSTENLQNTFEINRKKNLFNFFRALIFFSFESSITKDKKKRQTEANCLIKYRSVECFNHGSIPPSSFVNVLSRKHFQHANRFHHKKSIKNRVIEMDD